MASMNVYKFKLIILQMDVFKKKKKNSFFLRKLFFTTAAIVYICKKV